jgi:hypothetical protein
MNKYQEWYQRNKLLFNARRQQKYRQDSEFRKLCKTRQRSYLSDTGDPVVRVLPDGRAIEVYRAGQLIKHGISVAQIKEWEKDGWIPPSLFVNSPHRYYTPEQVNLLCELNKVVEVGGLAGINRQVNLVFKHWNEGI